MYLLYLDESGGPNSWTIQNHFVLGGVAVHEGQIRTLAEKMNAIQKKHFPQINVQLPFHATDIREGIGRYRAVPRDEREQILREVYQVIKSADIPVAVAFAVALNINSVQNPTQVLHDTFEEICSAFNNFLIWEYRAGFPNKGLLIIDEHRVGEYRQLLEGLLQRGTKYGYLGNIMDIPYFAHCPETRMLQLADFVANAVFRYYEKTDTYYFGIIMPCFSRRPTDQKIYGLRHITADHSCGCGGAHNLPAL
jgi:hypothetical protein